MSIMIKIKIDCNLTRNQNGQLIFKIVTNVSLEISASLSKLQDKINSAFCVLHLDLVAGPRVQLYPELVVTSPVESHEQVSSSQILPHDNLSPR